jgi:hypothetical protein
MELNYSANIVLWGCWWPRLLHEKHKVHTVLLVAEVTTRKRTLQETFSISVVRFCELFSLLQCQWLHALLHMLRYQLLLKLCIVQLHVAGNNGCCVCGQLVGSAPLVITKNKR